MRRRPQARSVALPALVLTVAGLLAGACATASPSQPGSVRASGNGASRTDTLRGTVAVVGADPLTRVVLQTDAGEQVTLTGGSLESLRRLDGIDVRCAGVARDEWLDVTSFRVVGAHGMPAVDGILELTDGVAVLLQSDGRRVRFEPAPSAISDWVGGRIWIAGHPGGEAEAWGMIRAPH